ncbi:TBC domain-containing protein [Colletotrichum sublineola]|uniref:Putative TBC domain-containing protein n=1 Tax=Colletotrichum sublineola TaxID=1173701 RepID=A0A066XLB5_COLSU|nr:TBC domain-containing protein [Colletotrichum sublineola]KDN66800.1 putative TBC domain-containing protein [Colletotrichum sublineola]
MTLMAVAADSVQPDAQIIPGAMADQGPDVNRPSNMKRRQFGIYASRRPHPKPIPTSDVPERPESDFPAAHPQPLPTSPPRWDSLANSSSNFVMQQNSINSHVQSLSPRRTAYDSDRHYPSSPTFRSLAPSPSHDPEDELSADEWTSRALARSTKPPFPYDDDHSSIDTMQVDNFSRPRGPSIKQPLQDSYRSRANQSPSEPRSDPNSHQHAWPRSRGHSGSSARSASTFASLPAAGSDPYEPRAPSRLRSAPAPSGLARPPLAYDRVDSSSSGLSAYAREAPWMSGEDEMRSSYRSQTTASSAQGTYVTERSSVLTKNSSIPSLYANGEELSVEDVMGMYEKGFRDDSSPEDNDDVRPVPAAEIAKRNTRMLEVLSEPRPVHAGSLAVPAPETIIPDSTAMFSISGSPASSPTEIDLHDHDEKEDEKDTKVEKEKRDSAKSLQNDAPPVSPQMDSPSASSTQTAVEPEPVEIEEPGTRDRYGFKKANQYITRQQYDAWDKGYSEYLDRRRKKWTAFLRENELMTNRPERFPPHSAKAKRFVRKGIPPEWRGAAWFYYAGGPAILAKHAGLYDTLLKKKARDVDVEAIERDLHRTFPDNIKFKPANMASKPNTEPTREGQPTEEGMDEPVIISSLRRVLHAFAIYNPRIGYCQSLNFLAGLLLLFMDSEEKAFWLLNVITRVYLPGTHEMSLEGSKVDLGVLMNAIRESMPAVWAKIGDDMEADPNATRPAKPIKKPRSRRKNQPSISSNRLPPITLCMTAWFMSCFIGTLPIESTLRVWDVIFYEGSKTLFRIALAIFKIGESEVRSISDPMEMFSVIQAMPRRLLDANALMEACFKRRNGFGHISQVTIDTEREERRVKVQTEHQRAATYTNGTAASGNATEGEGEVRRKGTLFGRRKSGRPAEVM